MRRSGRRFFVLKQILVSNAAGAQLVLRQRQQSCCDYADGRDEGSSMTIGLDDIVDDVLRRQPATFRIFLDYKMRCIGCPIARFHTIGEACRAHHVEPTAFLAALQAVEADQASD